MGPNSEIEVIPYQHLAGLLGQSPGWGLFIAHGNGRMNVGSILPAVEGKFMLNVSVLNEMLLSQYDVCEFSEFFDDLGAAIEAAQRFLRSNRRITNEERFAVGRITKHLLEIHKDNIKLAVVALETHMRMCEAEGNAISKAFADEIDKVCDQFGINLDFKND